MEGRVRLSCYLTVRDVKCVVLCVCVCVYGDDTFMTVHVHGGEVGVWGLEWAVVEH